jgi:hypothetical protein
MEYSVHRNISYRGHNELLSHQSSHPAEDEDEDEDENKTATGLELCHTYHPYSIRSTEYNLSTTQPGAYSYSVQ